MNDELEKEIRSLYYEKGPLDRGDIVILLLGLLARITTLETQVTCFVRRDTE